MNLAHVINLVHPKVLCIGKYSRNAAAYPGILSNLHVSIKVSVAITAVKGFRSHALYDGRGSLRVFDRFQLHSCDVIVHMPLFTGALAPGDI